MRPVSVGGLFALMQVNPDSRVLADARPMAGIDWTYYMLLAATLVIAVSTICILLFGM